MKSLQFHKLSRQNRKNAEEWMGRLWLLAIECNYKELDRQLKEQFIHGINDTKMLVEIVKELTKICENDKITSENVLSWAKRVEAQRAPSTIMNSLTEVKEFDKLKVIKEHTQGQPYNIHADKNACKATMQIQWQQPFPKMMPVLWEDMHRLQQNWPLQSGMQKQKSPIHE